VQLTVKASRRARPKRIAPFLLASERPSASTLATPDKLILVPAHQAPRRRGLHPARAVVPPPRLRAKCVGFYASLRRVESDALPALRALRALRALIVSLKTCESLQQGIFLDDANQMKKC